MNNYQDRCSVKFQRSVDLCFLDPSQMFVRGVDVDVYGFLKLEPVCLKQRLMINDSQLNYLIIRMAPTSAAASTNNVNPFNI